MSSYSEFLNVDDCCTEPDDETASDIRSVLEWCPGEIKSRQLERSTPTVSFDAGTNLLSGAHFGRKYD